MENKAANIPIIIVLNLNIFDKSAKIPTNSLALNLTYALNSFISEAARCKRNFFFFLYFNFGISVTFGPYNSAFYMTKLNKMYQYVMRKK